MVGKGLNSDEFRVELSRLVSTPTFFLSAVRRAAVS